MDHTFYMKMALREAEKAMDQDEVPVGAVIVKEEQIIAKAHNQVETLKDPTAHAELLAITQACNTTGDLRLEGATIYSTLEPCPMCMGAIIHARCDNLFYGAHDEKMGACGSRFDLVTTSGLNHYVNIASGIEGEASESLLKYFFQNLRKKKS